MDVSISAHHGLHRRLKASWQKIARLARTEIPNISTPFTKSGYMADTADFAFPETDPGVATTNLRTVVRQYAGTQHVQVVPSNKLLMILGRLRCLNHALCVYSYGVLWPNPTFLQYWRLRTLNLLPGFGFQVQTAVRCDPRTQGRN